MKAKESLLHKNLRAVVQTSVRKEVCYVLELSASPARKASDKFSGEKINLTLQL